MKLGVSNPNLSVILPVRCNAKCEFCIMKDYKCETMNVLRFLAHFKGVINKLPPIFKQISITGGEPTLFYEFPALIRLAKERFEKVVLNTNGFRLDTASHYFTKIDYINISRHHYSDEENYKIFKSDSVPDINTIRHYCSNGDVTLNCFLPTNFNDNTFIKAYVAHAKAAGAKVAFRADITEGDIKVLPVDTDDTLTYFHECPACLHRIHNIDGVQVTYKYGVKETANKMDSIYELVIHPDGKLTYDWAGNHELKWRD